METCKVRRGRLLHRSQHPVSVDCCVDSFGELARNEDVTAKGKMELKCDIDTSVFDSVFNFNFLLRLFLVTQSFHICIVGDLDAR